MSRHARRVFALVVACVSLAIFRFGLGAFGESMLAVVSGGVLLAVALVTLLTSWDRGRSESLFRLDWFVPALRRQTGGYSASTTPLGRVFRAVMPDWLQSDRRTKKRGAFRKFVRRIGLSWLASPVRRLVQASCLITFLGLFFYVCWPYDARPVMPSESSLGWTLQEIDQATGDLVLAREDAADGVLPSFMNEPGVEVVLHRSASSRSSDERPIGPIRIDGNVDGLLRVSPASPLSADAYDALLDGSPSFVIYDRDPAAWPSHYADNLASKERISAELFLVIDPLVSLSTAIAARSWVWSLACAAAILIVCVLIPRGFCGYLCPLGTTIDLFDWAVAGRTRRFRVPDDGWWVRIKYYLLAGTLVAAACGVLVSGFVSAIPVITRGLLFIVEPVVSGSFRGWHLVPDMHAGHVISVLLFAAVLGLGFLRPRFWCKYVCPSGAVFSLGNLFRVSERKVESSCINCNKCVEICPFDAIKPDFTTRTTDCTMCQSCGGVCPTHAIKFVERWNVVELKIEDDPPTNETALGRRGFLSLAAGGTAAAVGGVTVAAATKTFGASLNDPDAIAIARPPGSVPEEEFLQMCIRCGECFKACPNSVLQPEAFQQGLEGLWTPMVQSDWAGCESSCNACGQVCPTGAIRALPLADKRVARMGLAIVNESTCLPFAEREDCDLCVQECHAAGYHAIEYTQVGTEVDDQGRPIDGTGYLAPVVLPDLCVGCGLCQTRCHAINVKEKGFLSESAIIIEAGAGKEDRLMEGSYIALRESERAAARPSLPVLQDIPAAAAPTQPPPSESPMDDDPFGLGN